MTFKTSIPILFLVILKAMHAEEPEDPCPSNINHIVANMCTNDSTIEDSNDGSKDVDSVLVRITKQQNNCTCHVTLQNTATNYTIYMSKYDGLRMSAPEQQNCGLAVDVDYVDTSDTTRSRQSIECTKGTSKRSITLGGSELILQSRIIEGDFTRGYCMQIFRSKTIYTCSMIDQVDKAGSDSDWIMTSGTHHTSFDKCKRYCLRTSICLAAHYEYGTNYCFVYNRTTVLYPKQSSTYSQKHCVDTQKLKLNCYPQEQTTQISQVITTEDTFSTKMETETILIGNTHVTSSNTLSTDEREKKITKEKNSVSVPVIIVAVVGWCFTAFFAITTFFLYRRNNNPRSTIGREQNANNQYEELSASRLSSNYNSLTVATDTT